MTPAHECQVLIVEDNAEMNSVYVDLFEYEGFQAEAIDNGREALARLETVVPDLIILDLHIPGVSGLEILDYIECESRFAQTHVVIMTADALAARELEGRVDRVLVKPIPYEEFIKALALLGAD